MAKGVTRRPSASKHLHDALLFVCGILKILYALLSHPILKVGIDTIVSHLLIVTFCVLDE